MSRASLAERRLRGRQRRALQRGQREAHRRGLDVRDVEAGEHLAMVSLPPDEDGWPNVVILREFVARHVDDGKTCLYCRVKPRPACPVGHDDLPF